MNKSYLEHYSSTMKFSAGEKLFSQGDEPNGCYVIVEGSVGMHRLNPITNAVTDRVSYGPGDVVGSIGTIGRHTRKFTATATSDVKVIHITDAQVIRMSVENLVA